MRFHETMQQQILESDAQIQQLENELIYLNTEDRAGLVRHKAEMLSELEKQLKDAQKSMSKEETTLKEYMDTVEQSRAELKAKNTSCES